MTQRLDLFAAAPAQMKAWYEMSLKIAPAIEKETLELVKLRASQINGCANCLQMHSVDARKAGMTEQRIYLLNAWREAPCYSSRERAALAWTEALTLVSTERAPDDLYAGFASEFTPEEQVQLTLMINAINGWNRLAVGFNVFYEAVPAMPAAA